MKATGKEILRENECDSETVEHKQSSSIPQTLCMDMFLLALLVHAAPIYRLVGSTCCAWTWSTFNLYMLNYIAFVHKQSLNRNWTVWGEHPQIPVCSIMKKVEISQSAPVELLCNAFTQDCFDDRCIRNISRVMNMHVSVFANIWSCHVYKLSCITYISWGWKRSPT